MQGRPVQIKQIQHESVFLHGLSLVLGPIVHRNKYPIDRSRGLKVLVHNQSYSIEEDAEFLSLKPGEEANIAFERAFTSHTPWPYRKCFNLDVGFDSDLYRMTKRLNKTYRQKDCYLLFLQQKIQSECQCYFLMYPKMTNTKLPPCLNETQSECLQEVGVTDEDFKEFSLNCPLECDYVDYNIKVTSLAYPSLEEYEFLKQKSTKFNFTQKLYGIDLSTYASYKEYFYSFNIYYSSGKYTYISDSPQMTTFGLLSNLGGSLGMFLGFSVFSILEAIELLFKILFRFCFKK